MSSTDVASLLSVLTQSGGLNLSNIIIESHESFDIIYKSREFKSELKQTEDQVWKVTTER